jgi:hypothetical protein
MGPEVGSSKGERPQARRDRRARAVHNARRVALRAGVAVVFAAGTLACSASLPVAALARDYTYTWSMPHDFDPFSRVYNNWSYLRGSSLPLTFSPSFGGGLSGWTNDPAVPFVFVAVNPTKSSISGILPGQVGMQPKAGGSIDLLWNSPLEATTVSVSGRVRRVHPSPACGYIWFLTTSASQSIAQGSGTEVLPNARVRLRAFGSIYLVIYNTTAACPVASATTEIELRIRAPAPPPAVTLRNPGPKLVGKQPVFTGNASTVYGAIGFVTVRVYRRSSSHHRPLQILSARVIKGTYSVPANPKLADGAYTAQAEQASEAGQHAVSRTVRFSLRSPKPVKPQPPKVPTGFTG